MSGTIGRTISHYTILDQLGAGGMGVVYKARDVKLNRVVALKFLPAHLISDRTARTRFIQEARAASALDHPNIGTIYEIDESADAGLFIAMAYYPGESLAVRLRKGALPLAVAVDFAIQAGEGLACAHEHQIVHRDVKPGNLLATVDGTIKILDFGLAKAVDSQETDGLVCLGTPAFMAPERIHGAAVDHRCDIWSLGVVLYDMVAGHLPFDSENVGDLLLRISDADPAPPAPLVTPPELQAVVLKALSKRPAQRHKTMKEFVAALRSIERKLAETPQLGDIGSVDPAADTMAGQDSPAPQSPLSVAEHRQLTILSCELMEWTRLEERLDSELLREILVRYHEACEAAVVAFDGRVVQHFEGALTVHFGHPEAHEDDALRAVSAGLAISAAVGTLNADPSVIAAFGNEPLQVRVGIHTGVVIAPDTRVSRHSTGVVGAAGTIANRIREIARPGEVVATADTYRLVQGFFSVQTLGAKQLSASAKPVEAYRILNRTSAGTRIEAAGGALTALVGRARELRLLADCWAAVKEGSGQVILLSGEAGIGKSRLVKTFQESLSHEAHHWLEGRSSPHHRNSPLFPLIDLLGRIVEPNRAGSAEEKLGRLRKRLAEKGLRSEREVCALGSLLSIPVPAAAQPGSTPQRQREETLRALFKLVLAFAVERPLLFVMEDLHWADPSTLDFLGLLVDQGPTSRILTILTFRPEFSTPWDNRAHLVHLTLGRLSTAESEAMVQRIAQRQRLPSAVTKQLVDNSDGVPLFIEELTKTVLESSDAAAAGSPSRQMTLAPVAIPSTLRDSLMARLDRLAGAKQIAQLASVLGRTFPYEWLEAISPCGERLLRTHLSQLVEVELLYQRGVPPDASYTFKHALIRDAAYLSLLSRDRQQYHGRFAQALESRFPHVRDEQPELIAHHHREAGHAEQAASYWWLAGQQAVRRSAHVEAAAHFREGLELLGTLPDTVKRRQQQLDLVIALGGAQVATMGYAAPPVGEAFGRARALCAQVGESPQLFDALQGLYSFHLVRAELKTSLVLSRRLKTLAAHLDDGPRGLDAALRRGISLYTLGSLRSARKELEAVVARCDPNESRDTALCFGQDRLVASLSHLSLVLWLVGFPDRAVAASTRAVARARALSHPFSIAFALLYEAFVRSLRGEASLTRTCAESLIALCQEQGFAYRLAQSQILEGWAHAACEQEESAIENIQHAIKRTRGTGAEVLLPYYLMLLADACLRVHHRTLALDVTSEALAVVKRTGECFFQAELERLHGESRCASKADHATAAKWFSKALRTARHQEAASLELRAAMSWAAVQSDRPAARRQVEKIVNRLTEGFESEPFRAAQNLVQRRGR